MSWGKLDDRFWRHRKVRAAAKRDLAAVGLFAQAISFASEYNTDGRITRHDLEELCPNARRRRKLWRILVECELVERLDNAESAERRLEEIALELEPRRDIPGRIRAASIRNGVPKALGIIRRQGVLWLVHDYLHQNRALDEVLDDRRKDGDRKRRQRGSTPDARGRDSTGGEAEAAA